MKKATRLAAKVMTIAIAVTMIAGTTAFASELPCNTRTNSQCNDYTLLPLNYGTDGNGSAGGHGDVNWTVHCNGTAAAPAQVAGASRNSVDGFVDRLYSNTLHRSADAAGRAYWVEQLSSKKISGSETANGFINSPEFINQNLNNEQFVTVLYSVFFDRTPSASEVSNWTTAMANGATRAQIIAGFEGSQEWARTCAYYSINV